MTKNYFKTTVQKNKQISDNLFTLYLKSPHIARESKPGQFINIYFQNTLKIFPRPFSISQIVDNQILIRYEVIGTQTKKMSKWAPGREIKIMGPLGNSFDIPSEVNSHILVAGGIGIAPLFFLRDNLYDKGENIYFFSGAHTETKHYIKNDNKSKFYLATDDGSLGYHGNVVELLKENISDIPSPSIIYSCGPEPMLKSLKNYSQDQNIELKISMEKIMGCGQGLCQGCAIEAKAPEQAYWLVCKDGPVFNSKDIIINV